MLNKIITKDNLFSLRDFIQERTGLFFPESKFFSIEKLIVSNFLDSKNIDFGAYMLYLRSKRGEGHLRKLISLLITRETFFFREKPHFDLLKKCILPELISREAATSRTLSIWSAGCSTGEEPYSIAILLKKLIPQIETWKVFIIASDIDENVLQRAMKGEYKKWSFRGVDTDIINNCFVKKGDKYKIKEEYKPFVKFVGNNLISDYPPDSGKENRKFDLIICRNVTIYFEKETTMRLANKFHNVLEPGGYLIVGHAEHSSENYALFKPRVFPQAIVYQKNGKEVPDNRISLVSKPLSLGGGKGESSVKKDDFIKLVKEKNGLSGQKNLSFNEHRKINSEETGLFGKAIKYYNEKKYEQAIDCFLKVLDINSSNIRASWMLSYIAANRGYFEEALAWAECSIKINPLYKEPYYTLSLIHLAKGELNEAESDIKKAIYIDQNFIIGYFVLGNIYMLKRLRTQAEKYYNIVRDMLGSKKADEIIFQPEDLTVGALLGLVELRVRKV